MNRQTLLLRQVHPHFCGNGTPSSQAFIPFPKDQGGLSVFDGDRISPAAAYAHYTETLGFQSAGVWAVSVAEAEQHDLHARPAPSRKTPSHALIDFTPHPAKEWRKLAKRLALLASARSCLYPDASLAA